MGNKDIVSKTVLQKLAVDIATLLLKLDVVQESAEILETERQRFEVRRADVVVRMRDQRTRKPFIFHLEVQNNNDPGMPVRMLRYFTDIHMTYPDEPVQQYLVYIGKPRLTMPDGLQTQQLQYQYGMLDMQTVDCREVMAIDTPEALVLSVLCDFQQQSRQEMINTILIRLRQLTGEDETSYRNYYQMLETLAANRDLLPQLEEAKNMLSEIDVTQLPSYKWGKAKGLEQGLERVETTVLQIAQNLMKKGQLSDEDIAETTGLALSRVQKIRRESTH